MVQKGSGTAVQKTQGTTQPQQNYEKISQDPMKHVVTLIEKKIRNLEKRKVKLDVYRKMVDDGKPLDPDQTAAAAKYGEVIGSLEFAKDLIKTFETTTTEVMKQQRKASRKEQIAREEAETNRVRFILRSLRIMELLFTYEIVKDDFLNGTNGACVVPKPEMDQLINFYELFIMKSYDVGANIVHDANTSGTHLFELAEGRLRDIVGTTYKSLNILLGKISGSKYFDELRDLNDKTEIHHTPNQASSSESVEDSPVEDVGSAKEEEVVNENGLENQEVVENGAEVLETLSSPSGFSADAPLKTEEFLPSGNQSSTWQTPSQPQNPITQSPEAGDFVKTEESYQFTTTDSTMIRRAYEARRIQEVLAEVQGPCQFLQESVIEHELHGNQPVMQFTTIDMINQPPLPTTLSSHSRPLPPAHLHTSALESAFQTTQNMANIDQAIITSQSLPSVQQQTSGSPMSQEHLPVDQPRDISFQNSNEQDKKFQNVSGQNTFMANSGSQPVMDFTMSHPPMQQSDNLGLGQTTFGVQPQSTNDSHINFMQKPGEQRVYQQDETTSTGHSSHPIAQTSVVPDQFPPHQLASKEIPSTDSPVPHIPLPNEQQSGYLRFQNENNPSESKNVSTEEKEPQEQAGGSNRTQGEVNKKDGSGSTVTTSPPGDQNSSQNDQNTNYGSRNPPHSQSGSQQHRNRGGYNSGHRSGGGNQGGGNFQRHSNGGNYRGRYNNGNYDSMGRPNYSNNFQGNQSGGGGYRGHQDQYSGGYRRGGMRGNRGGQGRGNSRGGGNFRSRSYRPHQQADQST